MEGVLNFEAPLDVELFDQVVGSMNAGVPADVARAQRILTEFMHHEESWRAVGRILDSGARSETKYVALTILQHTINTRWNLLPPDQRAGVREFISAMRLHLAGDGARYRREQLLVHKLNTTLVDILKQDWPHRWPSFVADLVQSCQASDAVCHSNLNLLSRLSEEIFDYRSERLTGAKVAQLKQSLTAEFTQVFQLLLSLLLTSEAEDLLLEAMRTVLCFLTWIPEGYIFDEGLIEVLLLKFLPDARYRLLTVQCLTEVAGMDPARGFQYAPHFAQMFVHLVAGLVDAFERRAGKLELAARKSAAAPKDGG